MKLLSRRIKVEILNKKIDGKPYRLDEFIIYGQGTSDLNTPAETFQLHLLPHASILEKENTFNINSIITNPKLLIFWEKTLNKGDLISIGIETEHSWLYRIDSITKIKKVINNQIIKSLVIAGRSLASLLLDDDIVFAPELVTNKRAYELLGKRAEFLGILRGYGDSNNDKVTNVFINQPPLAAIVWIMLNMPSINIPLVYANYAPDGKVIEQWSETIGRIFTFEISQFRVDRLFEHQLNQYSGKVWNYLYSCLDPMFYEMFVETVKIENKPYPQLVIRPKPFDRKRHYKEKSTDITSLSLTDFTIEKNSISYDGQTKDSYCVTLPEGKINNLPETFFYWDEGLNYKNDNKEDNPRRRKVPSVGIGNDDYKFRNRINKDLYHILAEEEEYSLELATTTQNIVNYFIMQSSKEILFQTALAKYGYLFPMLDTWSIKQFGLRKLEGKSHLYKEDTEQNVKDAQDITAEEANEFNTNVTSKKIYHLTESVRLRERLFNHNRYNPILYEGTIQCLGHDHYRKGDKIFIPHFITKSGEKGIFAYITGVIWEYSITEQGSQYMSKLKIERGENPNDILAYDKITGYDLYDKNILYEGITPEEKEANANKTYEELKKDFPNYRVNPIIKVNSVFSNNVDKEIEGGKVEGITDMEIIQAIQAGGDNFEELQPDIKLIWIYIWKLFPDLTIAYGAPKKEEGTYSGTPATGEAVRLSEYKKDKEWGHYISHTRTEDAVGFSCDWMDRAAADKILKFAYLVCKEFGYSCIYVTDLSGLAHNGERIDVYKQGAYYTSPIMFHSPYTNGPGPHKSHHDGSSADISGQPIFNQTGSIENRKKAIDIILGVQIRKMLYWMPDGYRGIINDSGHKTHWHVFFI